MKKLIITVGISGSGKSTWAHSMFKMYPDNVRIINRDKIRELLFGFTEETATDYYLRKDLTKLEKEVTTQEDLLIEGFLASNKTVIVDATHLKREYIERFKYWNVTTELKIFQIQIADASKRLEDRKRGISKHILQKQFNQFGNLLAQLNSKPVNFETSSIEGDVDKPPCVIFDIDGTLAHNNGKRSPYDWAKVGRDTPDFATSFIFKCLEDFKNAMNTTVYTPLVAPPKLIICTGRDVVCLAETTDWLNSNELYYDKVYIREHNDMRPDWIVKEEMWREISKKYNIIGMFDDRQQVVRRARALGLKVFNVANNLF